MHRTLWVLCLLAVPLAGCIGSDEPAPSNVTPDEAADENTSTRDVRELPVFDQPRSSFDAVNCEGEGGPTDIDGCLRTMSSLETGPANEIMLEIDEAHPETVIAGSKDYRALAPDCAVVSVYSSTDGGFTWNDTYPREDPTPGPDGTTERCESDPVVAFDGEGNALLETLDTSQGLFTYRSTDQGSTWEEVAMAFEGGNDKNWMATDYRTGRVYSITRATCDGGQAVTWTDDSGDNWTDPVCFQGQDFSQIAVGPEGNVYAVGRAGGGFGLPGSQGAVMFAKSTDGGETWTEPTQIAEASAINALPVLGGHAYRTPALPDVGVSLGTGALYATWHDGGLGDNQDVYFAASFDEGETWTEPVVVHDGEGPAGQGDQFIPAVAASPAGDAHVIFFDARNDPTGDGHLLDVYYAHNPDPQEDPAGFEENLRLTPRPFEPYTSKHQTQPINIGDYVGLDATNERAVAAFPTTYEGRSTVHAAVIGADVGGNATAEASSLLAPAASP